MTSFLGAAIDSFSWSGVLPTVYRSSPKVSRSFCQSCGTPMAYAHASLDHEIHLYAATLDDPLQYQPERHVFAAEKLPWLVIDDGLPHYPQPARD